MFYFVIGFLILVIARLYINLKYTSRRIETNFFHEAGSVFMGMYLIFVFRYLSENIQYGTKGYILSVVLFVPLGILLPMLYARYRSLPIVIFASVAVAIWTSVFQLILLGKTEYINIIFNLMGAIIGYLVYCINAEIFYTVKRRFLVRKRKKVKFTTFLMLEADFIIMLVVCVFLIGNSTYRLLIEMDRDDGSEKLKEIEYDTGYSDIYYAEEDNYDRYDAYAKRYPDMEIEEVVWRVEANLDKEFYTDVYEYPDTEKDPLLLNKYNRVPDSYEPKELVTVYGDFLATPDTKAAFEKMQEDMKELGYELHIVSSYRSVSYQKGLYKVFVDRDGEEEAERYSARGGFSEHCTGRALDLSNNDSDLDVFAGSEEGKWAYENAYKYGFILRYPDGYEDVTGYMYESWHFSYVGTDISYKMKEEGIKTLEEYVVKYVEHKEK